MLAVFPFRLSPLIALALFVVARADDSKPPLSFEDVVREHFHAWDAKRTGKLTKEELIKRIENPRVKGMEAAAVVALYRAWRGATEAKSSPPPLTLNGLTDTKDKHIGKIASSYDRYWRRIEGASHELFREHLPGINGLHQGAEGDCYYLATVGMLAHQRPHTVRKMISPRPDGGFEVRFGDGRHTFVRYITDGELAVASVTTEQGLWPIVLEKAYGQLKKVKPWSLHEDPIDRMGHGGDGEYAIEAVTGNKARVIKIHKLSGVDRAPAVHEVLARSFQHKKMIVVAATGRASKVPPGMGSNHDYGVMNYDVKRLVVTLWNPWGNAHTPKGPVGMKYGYAVKGGQFEVPLDEFVQMFVSLYYEIPSLHRVSAR